MLYRLLVASALAAACTTSALAQDTTANSAAPAAKKPVKEHKICRQDVATGSIMPRSTCHTKAEWDEIDAQNSRNSAEFRQQREMYANPH